MRLACKAFLCLLLLLWGFLPARAQADPVLAMVDDYVSSIWPGLVQAQSDYYSLSGKYFQGLPTHTTIPGDGGTAYPDLWYGHPIDQQYTWQDLNGIPLEAHPCSFQIDTYSGPEGSGWVLTASVSVGGSIYSRAWAYGPEALYNSDWGIR